jgi:hypothetical protein
MTIVAKVARSYTPADFLIPDKHVEIQNIFRPGHAPGMLTIRVHGARLGSSRQLCDTSEFATPRLANSKMTK